MNKSEKFLEKLYNLKLEILETILSLLKERKVKSINLYEYWSERNADRYTFYDTDEDGYGVALYVEKLFVTKDGIELKMLDVDDGEWGDWDEENLSTNEMCYILEMVEQVLEIADEDDGGRVLKASESFDDWDD